MISVDEARARILAALTPVGVERVALGQALGRTLAKDVAARTTSPPVAVSAMDGYAVRAEDVARAPVELQRIGEAPAGGMYPGVVGEAQAVRIFTGGPVPLGADTVVIQENTTAVGDEVIVREPTAKGRHIRPAGLDFKTGDVLLHAGRRLTARDIGLAAAMNVAELMVRRRPKVAILATGTELVGVGAAIAANRIVNANSPALVAVVEGAGGEAVDLGVARDDIAAIQAAAARAADADLFVVVGGASVGDHDLVQKALTPNGLSVGFWKIALRPGKPLMFGTFGAAPTVGLPGNPVSALVCALVFLRPAIAALLGRNGEHDGSVTAVLGRDLGANDGREDYLRSTLARRTDGALVATPFERQDSSMLALLAASDCLAIRPPNALAAKAGEAIRVIPFGWGVDAF